MFTSNQGGSQKMNLQQELNKSEQATHLISDQDQGKKSAGLGQAVDIQVSAKRTKDRWC